VRSGRPGGGQGLDTRGVLAVDTRGALAEGTSARFGLQKKQTVQSYHTVQQWEQKDNQRRQRTAFVKFTASSRHGLQ
jgi:hypothetical protein